MRILITGINGFVGGFLAEQLLSTNKHEIWGFGRRPEARWPNLHDRVQFVTVDLLHREQVAEGLGVARPNVIFHLAGQSNVPRSFEDPTGTLTNNTLAQLNLFLGLLQLRQDPLIFVVTSNEIYGRIEPEDLPLRETTPFRPVNPYAVSKASQDLLAYQYHASHGLRTVRLRPFNHIGPRQSEAFVLSAFAAQIARIEAKLQAPVMRVGNLSAERDFTDVRDMVRAYAMAAELCQPPEAYNIGSGRCVSVRWLLDTLLTLSECDITVEPDPSRVRPVDVPRVVSDSTAFRQQTGWKPEIPLEQTLFDVLEYWRARVRAELK